MRTFSEVSNIPRALASLVLLVVSGWGEAAIYSDVINDASWQAESSPFECRLTNSIPSFGTAVFRKGAGEEETEFLLNLTEARLAEGSVSIRAEAPLWRPEAGSLELGTVPVSSAPQPVHLPESETQRLLAELYRGREIVFSSIGGQQDNAQSIQLSVTSIAFRNAYQTFKGCLAELLPVNFDQIRRTAVYFQPGDTDEIPDAQVQKLEQILRYAQADRYLKEIYIDGHTDSRGTREENLELSEQRARLVTDYLIKRGMPEDRIVMRWHGERYPVESNAGADGRAQNRRVTVRLERVEPVDVPQLAASLREDNS